MKITSNAFAHMGNIPEKYTCEGEGISPQLVFKDIPNDARSLALIVEDPDVPQSIRQDGMWDHWLIWNIDPSTAMIEEGEKIDATYGTTTSGTRDFVPPCPPDREHRYIFKLYALDTVLDVTPGAKKVDVMSAMEGHIIDQAEIIGLYCKKENRQ